MRRLLRRDDSTAPAPSREGDDPLSEDLRSDRRPLGPYDQRSQHSSRARHVLYGIALILLVAALAGVYWWRDSSEREVHLAQRQPQPQPAEPPQPRGTPDSEQEIVHPVPQTQPPPGVEAKPVPPLQASDDAIRDSLVALLGKQRVADLFIPKDIVHHIVSTVDNLPRRVVAARLLPVKSPAGQILTSGEGEVIFLSAANYARYDPYVRVVRATDVKQLIALYAHFYPLFQQAYQELGYPKKHFNDRLVEVIDHLLDAPDPQTPVKLVRPKVMFEFDDPELEELSAGQKILLRMGPENAAVVKAKLREIRNGLVAESRASTKN